MTSKVDLRRISFTFSWDCATSQQKIEPNKTCAEAEMHVSESHKSGKRVSFLHFANKTMSDSIFTFFTRHGSKKKKKKNLKFLSFDVAFFVRSFSHMAQNFINSFSLLSILHFNACKLVSSQLPKRDREIFRVGNIHEYVYVEKKKRYVWNIATENKFIRRSVPLQAT
jgi:hypothetical protein